MHLYKRPRGRMNRGLMLTLCGFAAVAAVFVLLVGSTKKRLTQRSAEQLAYTLRRAAVTCYSVEGCYPPSLAYLTERYGVIVDTGSYIIQYDVFADNVMPDIAVYEIGGGA